jgi:AcrR family transcriptional regulator
MAHEVIKRVGARAYRYRVESYRDPETKKVRSRWTYLGRVERVGEPGESRVAEKPRREARHTRDTLLDAFARIAERRPFAEITAGAVAEEAGFAHGTFYRYFRDKRALLLAAVERVRAEIERERPSFDPPYGTRETELARLRAWTDALASVPVSHGILRAWYDALDRDPSLAGLRAARVAERTLALEGYLAGLIEARTIEVERPASLAIALTLLVDAAFRSATVAGAPPDARLLAGVSDVFARAIFTASSGSSETKTPAVGTSPKEPT